MSAEIKFAQREFQDALEKCIKETERTYDKFLNGQGLALAKRALDYMQKADAGRVAAALGQRATKVRWNKKGKIVKTRVFDDDQNTLAARIINARRAEAGKPLLFGKPLVAAVKKLVGARVRAVAFIKSGYVPAIRGLAKAVGYNPGSGDSAKSRGVPKGYVIPAKPAISSVVKCEIANTALLAESAARTGSRKGAPMSVAEKGLSMAFSESARDMMAHLAKKLNPVFAKFSAK